MENIINNSPHKEQFISVMPSILDHGIEYDVDPQSGDVNLCKLQNFNEEMNIQENDSDEDDEFDENNSDTVIEDNE